MASDQPLIASVDLWAANFAPRGWAFCQGQTMSIQQNTALFSLIGTTYGGNGQSTFQLPDLRGRVPVGAGQGLGLSDYVLGEMAGTENITLTISNMPSHNHIATGTVNPKAGTGKITLTGDPTNNFPGQSSSNIYTSTNNAQMGQSPVTVTVQPAGNNLPFSIMQPFLVLNYIIALTGIFPSRN